MADRAKLFENGGDQAVRLSEDHFDGQDEVMVSRAWSPPEPCSPAWSTEFLELAGAAADFPCSPEVPHVEPGLDLEHRGDK